MKSRPSHLLVVLLLTTGLFAQAGLPRAPRSALATFGSYSAPVSRDVYPVNRSIPEEEDNRGEESTRGDPTFGVPASHSSRRNVPGRLNLPTGPAHPAAYASRNHLGPGHFLAAGRPLRYWIQSQRC